MKRVVSGVTTQKQNAHIVAEQICAERSYMYSVCVPERTDVSFTMYIYCGEGQLNREGAQRVLPP
jgi:tRNA A22 N-methylase